MLKRLLSFFKKIFGSGRPAHTKDTDDAEPRADQTAPVPLVDVDTIANNNKNELDMTADRTKADFSSEEPLINHLTDFLSVRLQQLAENDHAAFVVPDVPDWEGCGKTLSENFSRFVKALSIKKQEYALGEESPVAAIEWDGVKGKMQVAERTTGQLTDDEKWILIIALVPHIYPHFYDEVIFKNLENPGEYPQLGFLRGKDFRGFIPTGETVFFLLAGNNYDRRLDIQQLLQGDRFFAHKKILWLEELVKGEPVMSGKLILSQDYLDTIMYGRPVPPGFSMNFPARQIRTNLNWEDLVINEDLQKQIDDIKNWLRFEEELEHVWDMKRRLKQGYRTLFYGPSGTGKTLSAGLLGKEIKKDVYKIDLSMVVSKYIGETEKNLEMLFARAEDKGWILFFDEADALFGKRTNVRDAHDKYANQEVSYLLQRIEDYNGLVILATNMKNNIDDAFIRRFNSILKFPFPNAEERSLIWEKSFPAKRRFCRLPPDDLLTPDDQVETVDIPQLVSRYELTGGSIINVVHYAGIKAVERLNERREARKKAGRLTGVYAGCNDDENIEARTRVEPQLVFYLSDVLNGIRREMLKEGKPFVN